MFDLILARNRRMEDSKPSGRGPTLGGQRVAAAPPVSTLPAALPCAAAAGVEVAAPVGVCPAACVAARAPGEALGKAPLSPATVLGETCVGAPRSTPPLGTRLGIASPARAAVSGKSMPLRGLNGKILPRRRAIPDFASRPSVS